MRAALDRLYDVAAWIAAASMVGLLAMVLLGIAGRQFGFYLPGTDAWAGYLMAGAGFLSLAHTLKRNEHIRVTLLLGLAGPRTRRALERWALGVALLLAGLLAFYSVRLAWQSYLFNDISTAADATPLWLPQLSMAAGSLILLVAFVDELVLELRGRRAGAPAADMQRVE
ncbi:MAG: TRAP transporter small permease subunit [Burkholderiales bacterium]|nr:TRAP transporter small permease subunit [Burkholderiales bacterium]HMM52566.1 TRAP transporter small permease subunit [Burkholderiaceae bacterium]